MPFRRLVFLVLIVGCSPGLVLDEVDSVIEDARSETTLIDETLTASTTPQDEPPDEVDGGEPDEEIGSIDEGAGERSTTTSPGPIDGQRVLIIGDSVLAATTTRYGGRLCDELTSRGWNVEIDAEKGRFVDFADLVINERLLPEQGLDWDVIVIGLGSNLAGSPLDFGKELASVVQSVAPRAVVLITVAEFEPSRQQVNEAIRQISASEGGIRVIEWSELVSLNADLVASDGIHLTSVGRDRLTEELSQVLGDALNLSTTGQGECYDSPFTNDDRDTTGILATLASLSVKPESDGGIAYDRSAWPHWLDVDGSGCDTRDDVLAAEVIGLPQVDIFDRCTIVEADWYSAYDEVIVSGSPSQVHIDHIVALAEAHRSGGASWSTETKTAFANFRPNLVAVSAASNISKSDRDVSDWRPARSAWCSLATQVVLTKSTFDLSVDEREYESLVEMLTTCGQEGQLVLGSSGVALGDVASQTEPAQANDDENSSTPIDEPADTDDLVNPGNSKNCSDFATYGDAKEWFDRYFAAFGDVALLDGDDDGEPCESLPGAP